MRVYYLLKKEGSLSNYRNYWTIAMGDALDRGSNKIFRGRTLEVVFYFTYLIKAGIKLIVIFDENKDKIIPAEELYYRTIFEIFERLRYEFKIL